MVGSRCIVDVCRVRRQACAGNNKPWPLPPAGAPLSWPTRPPTCSRAAARWRVRGRAPARAALRRYVPCHAVPRRACPACAPSRHAALLLLAQPLQPQPQPRHAPLSCTLSLPPLPPLPPPCSGGGGGDVQAAGERWGPHQVQVADSQHLGVPAAARPGERRERARLVGVQWEGHVHRPAGPGSMAWYAAPAASLRVSPLLPHGVQGMAYVQVQASVTQPEKRQRWEGRGLLRRQELCARRGLCVVIAPLPFSRLHLTSSCHLPPPLCSTTTNTFDFIFKFQLERDEHGQPVPPKMVLPSSGKRTPSWCCLLHSCRLLHGRQHLAPAHRMPIPMPCLTRVLCRAAGAGDGAPLWPGVGA